MDSKMKRAQVTIFIILAIVLVVAIVAIFILIKNIGTENPSQQDPKSFIQSCAKDSIESAFKEVLEEGGVLDSQKNIMYDGENNTYLCYNADYYLTCYNLHPMLEEKIEADVREKTKNEIQECFNLLKENLEGEGYTVSGGSTDYSIDLLPSQIKIILTKKISYSKGESSQAVSDFSYEIVSPIYEMVNIAREIVNSESQECNFEYNGFMLLYPDFKIARIDYDGSKIYQITDRSSGEEFKFAIRGCVFPSGI